MFNMAGMELPSYLKGKDIPSELSAELIEPKDK
jgi:flotillin